MFLLVVVVVVVVAVAVVAAAAAAAATATAEKAAAEKAPPGIYYWLLRTFIGLYVDFPLPPSRSKAADSSSAVSSTSDEIC